MKLRKPIQFVLTTFVTILLSATITFSQEIPASYTNDLNLIYEEIVAIGELSEKKLFNQIEGSRLQELERKIDKFLSSKYLFNPKLTAPNFLHYTNRDGIVNAYLRFFGREMAEKFDTKIILIDALSTTFETDFYGYANIYTHLINLKHRDPIAYEKALKLLAIHNGACFAQYSAERQFAELCLTEIGRTGFAGSTTFATALELARESLRFAKKLGVSDPEITSAIKFDLAKAEISTGSKPKGFQLLQGLSDAERDWLMKDDARRPDFEDLMRRIGSKENSNTVVRDPDRRTLEIYYREVLSDELINNMEKAAVLVRLLQKKRLPNSMVKPLKEKLFSLFKNNTEARKILKNRSDNAKMDLALFWSSHSNFPNSTAFSSFLFEKRASHKQQKARQVYKTTFDDLYSQWGNDRGFFQDAPKIARAMETVGYPAAAYHLRKQIVLLLSEINSDVSRQMNMKTALAAEFLETYVRIADVAIRSGNHSEAIEMLNEAIVVARTRFANEWRGGQQAIGDTVADLRPHLIEALGLWGVLSQEPAKRHAASIADSAFQTAQLIQLSDVALALQAGIRNSVVANSTAKELLRSYENANDEVRHLATVDDELNFLFRDGIERALENSKLRREQAETQVKQILPFLEEFLDVSPVGMKVVQSKLNQSEALILLLPTPNGTAVFALTPGRARFSWSAIDNVTLAQDVEKLRKGLSPADVDLTDFASFDAALAHSIYRKTIGLVEREIDGARDLIVVADGALTSLPLHVLIASDPTGVSDFSDLNWLLNTYAITNATSVRSVIIGRSETVLPSQGNKKPFVGFGDPVFNETSEEVSGDQTLQITQLSRGVQENTAALKSLQSLPETGIELYSIAHFVGATPDDVIVGSNATETKIKQMSADGALRAYKVLYFATHGLVAGELDGISEPGLVMTVPSLGNELDDGFLSSSEVSKLELDADWVVLSACNTAAPGTSGAVALTGLAKSFFKAGSRSVLASHWPVVSDAAVFLTTGTFEKIASTPNITRAEALRQTMRSSLSLPGSVHQKHPAYWAPFVLVGGVENRN